MTSKLDCGLQKWALDLTQRYKVFGHDQQLKPQNFSNLTKDERLQPILSFLIRHVRPPEEQRQIKLNLKHAQLRKKLAGGDCETTTSEERFRLKAAIIDARATVSSEAAEIQQLSQRKEECRQHEVNFRRRMLLLKVVEEERRQEIQHCKSWNSQLSLLIDSLCNKKSKVSVIDSHLQRQLQGNLLSLENLRHSINSKKVVSQMAIHEEKLWEDIRETLEDWSPRPLFLGLLGKAKEGNRTLQSLIQQVDLVRDAHDLRVKCEKDGSFIDEMNPGGVIESVCELLGQMSATHVKLYIEAHRTDVAAASLSRTLNTLMNNIAAAAKRTYSDENVALGVINLVKENISVVGEHAALNMTQTLTGSLQERADVAARARDVLRSKYAKIVSFNKEVKQGVESIHCLALSIKDGLKSIDGHIEKVKSDVDGVLGATTHPTPVSVNALKNECDSFASLPLGYLLTMNVDGYGMQPKMKMTTTPLVWYDKSHADAGWMASSSLGCSQLFWDGLYSRVVDSFNLTTSLQNQMEQLMSLRAAAASSAQKKGEVISRQEVKELIEAAEKSDKTLERDLKKVTDACERKISEGAQHVIRVNKVLSEWWEQPAKKVISAKTA